MKKWLLCACAVLLAAAAPAQTTADQYQSRYDLLVGKVGVTGLGVETLLDKWAADFPDDGRMHYGRFLLRLGQAARTEVVTRPRDRFLGQEPLLTLKDSLGRPVYYYQETFYDEELFGEALQSAEKAVSMAPDRLDFRLGRITALLSYEKESPDMTAAQIKGLIDYHFAHHPKWVYPGSDVSADGVFEALIQEYCVTFFRYGVPGGYEAFRTISERMLSYRKDDPLFLDNMGSYYLVGKGDGRTALKYYNKVLKKHPDDLTAIRNCIVLARNQKDTKLERKYLALMVKYAPDDVQRESARVRMDALKK